MTRIAVLLAALFASTTALADVEKIEAGAIFAKAQQGATVKILEKSEAAAKVLSSPPNGTRLAYRKKLVAADGKVTWYFVSPPGRAPGWVSAGDTVATRPEPPPPPKMIKPIDSGLMSERPTAAQTAAARGLSDSAKSYASAKQDMKLTVDQFLTLEKTVEEQFKDPHEHDGSYPDVTVEGRKKKAAEFKAGLK